MRPFPFESLAIPDAKLWPVTCPTDTVEAAATTPLISRVRDDLCGHCLLFLMVNPA